MIVNYVICYDIFEVYVEWVGVFYECFFCGFYIYWENKDVELFKLELLLVVLVFFDFDFYW